MTKEVTDELDVEIIDNDLVNELTEVFDRLSNLHDSHAKELKDSKYIHHVFSNFGLLLAEVQEKTIRRYY